MRAFGARGYVSQQQLERTNRILAEMRREQREKERAEIAALSDRDIQKIMARKIIERAPSGSIFEHDMIQAGIPQHRIASNQDGAMRLARRQCPRLDAILSQPGMA